MQLNVSYNMTGFSHTRRIWYVSLHSFLPIFFDSTCMIQAASSVLPLISPPVSIGSLIDSIQHIPPSRRSLFLYLYRDVDHRNRLQYETFAQLTQLKVNSILRFYTFFYLKKTLFVDPIDHSQRTGGSRGRPHRCNAMHPFAFLSHRLPSVFLFFSSIYSAIN